MTDGLRVSKRFLAGKMLFIEMRSMYEPAVFPAAIKDIFYIDDIVLYLIKNQIPLFNKHLVIFVLGNVWFLKEGKTPRVSGE